MKPKTYLEQHVRVESRQESFAASDDQISLQSKDFCNWLECKDALQSTTMDSSENVSVPQPNEKMVCMNLHASSLMDTYISLMK